MKLNLFMCFVLKKALERFSILFTYSSYSLQICIKPCCMYLSCQLLFKTPHKIPTKIAAAADKENIGKHDRMEVFSTEKKLMFINNVQAMPVQSERGQKCIFQQSGNLNFKNFSFAVHSGYTSWRQ